MRIFHNRHLNHLADVVEANTEHSTFPCRTFTMFRFLLDGGLGSAGDREMLSYDWTTFISMR